MRQAEPRAERIGDRVAGGGVHRPEADAAVVGGEQQARPRLGVAAVRDGAREIPADQVDPHARVGVDQRMRAAVGEGLDAMRQRVDAGRRRDGAAAR